ncbi:Trifunctional enzyme subunit alpha, mitochondrial [Armadillidium nasatum]|uniref:Trifunctional enzyme subunit alpha, mitochondrial n=1 Tax=Armadillidium nasatum TaxID=96803 RepID=A0A5N5TPC7_9CRUS|nr:Trifunctional enzyme subunit alpha, mitochondrial [Armadillidium nasatum]
MAMFQKFPPTWNHICKIKQIRLASYILNKNNQIHFLSPNSTCLSVNNLDYCKKWRLPFESNLSRHSLTTAPSFNYIKTERRGEGNKVGIIIIDRPNVLNALNSDVTSEIVEALVSFENDPKIGAIVLTGRADIKELASGTDFSDVYSSNKFRKGEAITSITKPIIAAVNGFALGGGCELVLLCDIIIAGEKAKTCKLSSST